MLGARARRRVLDVASTVLGALPESEVPTSLARVRQFAPGRRAAAGAGPLAAALERDAGFRARVAAAVREAEPELVAAVAGGDAPAAADPDDVAVVAFLVRPDGWQQVLERCREDVPTDDGAVVERLRADLDLARADARRAAVDAEAASRRLSEDLATTRRELRRHRSDADRARAQARDALAEAEQVRAAAASNEQQSDERARRHERDLAVATDALQALRRAGREGRSLAGSRARLLLDTLVDAAVGLRHELALPPVDVLPADVLARELDAAAPTTPPRARDDDDPTVLDDLLTLPRAHLVVDGYNVTKSAYGALPLLDQRQRLVTGLGALAARTRAEVTCVFDGAAQDARVTTRAVRGVRVLFSEPDEIADELIRRLVRAEPPGRVVIVVSSDREVAEGVLRSGARPVPSAALVRLLGRG